MMTIEKTSSEELLVQFKERHQNLVSENQQLAAKIRENEATALKLLGAIETLEYLETTNDETTESVEE